MIRNTFAPRARPGVVPVIFFGATAILLATRIANAGSSPVEWMRAAIGAISFGVLIALRSGGLVRAAAYAFAIECVGGIVLFAFLDAPAVLANTPAIVRFVANVAPHGLR